MNFKNRTALVTGAAVGIGHATAVKLAQNGASLVIVDINKDKLESVKAEIEEYTKNVMAFVCDVGDEEKVYRVVKEVESVFSKIDILVNDAVLWRCWASFVDTSTDEWRKFININIMGVVYFTKTVLPKILESSYGRIINIASVAGVYGNANMNYFENSELSFMGRTGTYMEIANLVCFLASDEASYISGQNIQIDGCRKKQ